MPEVALGRESPPPYSLGLGPDAGDYGPDRLLDGPSGGGLRPDGGDEREGGSRHLPAPGVAQDDFARAQRLAWRQPREHRVDSSPGREAPDAGVAQPRCPPAPERHVVLGPGDELRG